MQKKFVIIENDKLLNDLIVQQMPIVFENYFNIKFLYIKKIGCKPFLKYLLFEVINLRIISNDNFPARIR